MVLTLNDTKRTAIAEKLADICAVQNLIIENENEFLRVCDDSEIHDRFQRMLADDKKNIGVIETVITQYGIQEQPTEKTQELVQKTQELMKGSKLSFYEKVVQHELLKHAQFMAGVVVHKAAQVVGADVEVAITPLNTFNFESRAHQEQLKGVLEVLGTRELTGHEPDQSVWARVQDAISAFSGVVGSAVTQNSNSSDMNIQEIIFADHRKVDTLFMQIEKTDDAQKIQEYFGQLYKDLSVHSEAEEQIVYPTVRPFYGNEDTQELYDEQAELKVLLEKMKAMDANAPEFKACLKQAKEMVRDHTRQEESTMFAAIGKNCSKEEQEQLGSRFKEAKKQLQIKM
ncbi:hemerythrin domain-containing protein [Leptolyngbyaceae cyanobacterium UHCC 1019]